MNYLIVSGISDITEFRKILLLMAEDIKKKGDNGRKVAAIGSSEKISLSYYDGDTNTMYHDAEALGIIVNQIMSGIIDIEADLDGS